MKCGSFMLHKKQNKLTDKKETCHCVVTSLEGRPIKKLETISSVESKVFINLI